MPHYVATSLGLFSRAGVEVVPIRAESPGSVSRLLLTGEAEVGLAEPAVTLGVVDRGEGRLVSVAELAGRAGSFLLTRSPVDLEWRALRGRRVLVAAEERLPRLCLEYLLERHGVALGLVSVSGELPVERAVETFLAGRADYLLLGQPDAEVLVVTGQAHVVASLGAALGPISSGGYLAAPRTLAERREPVAGLLRGLAGALGWLRGATPDAVAGEAAWAFPGLDRAVLAAAIHRLQVGRVWPMDPVPRRTGLDALQEVLLLRGEIRSSRPYPELVAPGPAEAAVRAVTGSEFDA